MNSDTWEVCLKLEVRSKAGNEHAGEECMEEVQKISRDVSIIESISATEGKDQVHVCEYCNEYDSATWPLKVEDI
jgi:hypothetical protein